MTYERGSALITVILVVLVLTMVGLAAMLFMTVEDSISGNDRFQKEALYLAEAGLRAGEARLASVAVAQITGLLQAGGTAPPNQVPPTLKDARGYAYLGTVLDDGAGGLLYDVAVPYAELDVPGLADPIQRFGYFSVYVRNDRMDSGGNPTLDANGRVDLIAVGTVKNSAGVVQFQKILAEEFFLGAAQGSTLGPQIGGYQSGQNVQSF